MAPLVGLEPTTYRLTAERSTNWAKEEYINLATTYLLSRVTRKYCRHIGAWLLCSVWEHVFPPCNHHQKCFVCFLAHSKIHRNINVLSRSLNLFLLNHFFSWLSPRIISTDQLNTLLYLHLQPINHIVFMESYYLTVWDILS